MIIGTYPSLISWVHLWVLASNPNSFSRKIAHKMMWDRNPQNTVFADKVLVRDYVSALIGPQYLSNLIWVGKDITSFDFENAPSNFVIKPNHGSHAAILVSEIFDENYFLPSVNKSTGWQQYFINPNSLNIKILEEITRYWLSLSYYKTPNKFHEWAYKDIVPQLMIEEYLQGVNQGSPQEFRFFMFQGKCELVYCFSNRFEDEQITLIDPSGLPISGEYLGLRSNLNFEVPMEFADMLNIAGELSRGVNFVRVDLYLTDKGIIFSELTNYPMGGLKKFKPEALNKSLGINWIL